MLAYCSHCAYNLFIRAGNRGRWPASVKIVTLPYLTLFHLLFLSLIPTYKLLYYRYWDAHDIVVFLSSSVLCVCIADMCRADFIDVRTWFVLFILFFLQKLFDLVLKQFYSELVTSAIQKSSSWLQLDILC